MPGEKFAFQTDEAFGSHTGAKFATRYHLTGKRKKTRSVLCGILAILSVMVLLVQPVFAAETGKLLDLTPFKTTSLLIFAITIGIVSFALLSAFWLIRERGRISDEHHQLKKQYGKLRASHERLDSLVNNADQCLVVWSGEQAGQVMGWLDPASGAPEKKRDFLAFGKWLVPNDAGELEAAIGGLRTDGEPFSLCINTKMGSQIEAIGRVSGSHAFVRFCLLEGAYGTIAQLQDKCERLTDRFNLIESTLSKASTPVWLKDRDGRLVYANKAYVEAVEAKNVKDIIGEKCDLFDQRERDAIKRSIEKSGSFSGQIPAIVAGDRRKLETFEIGNKSGFAGLAIDRSDTERARDQLRQTISGHENTFNHLAAAIAIFDEKQRLQFFNASFQKFWGFTSADLKDHPGHGELLEILRANKRLQEVADWRGWKNKQLGIYQSTETVEEQWYLPDGQTIRVIINPQNQGGVSWVIENLTEALQLKTNYNSLIKVQGETLDHLNEAVAVFGSDGKLRLTNPAFVQMWGFDQFGRPGGEHVSQNNKTPNGAELGDFDEPIENLHIREISRRIKPQLADEDDWEKIKIAITGVDDKGRDGLFGRLEDKKGNALDYRLVYLPNGQTMLNLVDMTASVNVERALQERNEALEASGALKTRFIENVSYELRVPLTSISGFASILAEGGPGQLNTKQNEYIGYINSASDVLTMLIDDILDIASIDAGQMALNVSQINIDEIVTQCLEGLGAGLEQRQITVKRDYSKDAKTLLADPARIRRVLYNLLSNAVHASPDGGTIIIEAKRVKDRFELSVSDAGPGLSGELQKSVFERFETGEGNRKWGVGLGLSIVKSFTELHGGTVKAENNADKGACFTCSFPDKPQSVAG